MTGLASRPLAPRTVCGLVDEGVPARIRHAPLLPACGSDGPFSDRYRSRRVRSRSRNDRSRSRRERLRSSGRHEARHDRLRSRDRRRSRDRLTLSSDRSRSRKRSWWPSQMMFLPPGIAATLGRGWSLTLQWWETPLLCPRLPCRTSPGCSSACWGSLRCGMWLGLLCFRLRASTVPGRCQVLLLR